MIRKKWSVHMIYHFQKPNLNYSFHLGPASSERKRHAILEAHGITQKEKRKQTLQLRRDREPCSNSDIVERALPLLQLMNV